MVSMNMSVSDAIPGAAPVEEVPVRVDPKGLLTAAEEIELSRAWRQSRCEVSRNKLIESNLRLVHAIARTLDHRGIPREELFAEGTLGLLRAATNYDPDSGCRFSTFAYSHIRHAMLGLFSARSPKSKLPRGMRREVGAWETAVATLRAQHGEEPTDAMVAEQLGWTESAVRRARAAHSSMARLASGANVEDAGECADDDTPAEGREVSETFREQLSEMLEHLKPKERRVIELLYGISAPWRVTREAAASILGCSTSTVRQLQAAAEFKLRRHGRAVAARMQQEAAEVG